MCLVQFARVPEYLTKLNKVHSTLNSMQSKSTDLQKRVKTLHDKCVEDQLAATVAVHERVPAFYN